MERSTLSAMQQFEHPLQDGPGVHPKVPIDDALRRHELPMADERRVLELIASGAPLSQALDALVHGIEERFAGKHALASVLVLDKDGVHLRHGSAPSLPEGYNRAIDGIAIGPCVGSCGTAAFRAERVIVSDIATDPLWKDYSELGIKHGLRACWSTPITGADGKLLGTFAIYYPEPGLPSDDEIEAVELVRQTAAIAIALKRTEEKLRESEERFRAMADNIPQLSWMADAECNVVWFNRGWLDYTGTTLEENLGVGWKAVHHPDYVDRVAEKFERHLREGKEWEDTFPLRGKDGRFRWFLSRMKVIRDASGKVERFFGTNTDVTEQREMAESLREAGQRFRFMAESMPQKIFTAKPTGDVDYFNRQCMEYTGLTFEQIKDWGWTQFIHADDLEENVRRWRHSIDTGEPFDIEHRLRRSDGIYRWHLARAHAMRDAEGKIVMWTGSNTDIEDIKAAAEKLRGNKQQLDIALAASDTGTFRWDPHTGEFLAFDDNLKRLFGKAPEAQFRVAEDFIRLVHPDDVAAVVLAVDACRRGADFSMEYRVMLEDGGIRWLYHRAKMEWENEKPIYLVGACTDSTERKWAESLVGYQRESLEMVVKGEELEQVLDFLARAMESQSQAGIVVAIHLIEADGHHFGYVAAPSLPKSYAEATRGMDARMELGPCSSAVVSHKPTVVRDFAAPLPKERWPAFSAEVVSLGLRGCFTTPILSSDQKVLGTFAIYYREPRDPSAHDRQMVDFVTRTVAVVIDRKQAEEALRESEERFRTVADNMSQLAWTCDSLGTVTWYNQRWLDYTGMTFEEMQGWGWRHVQHPDHIDRVVQGVERSRDTGKMWEDTFPLRGKDGSYRWFLSRAIPIRDDGGKLVRWFGTNTDITEIRSAEEALRRSEKLAALGRLAATMAHEINNPLESVTNLLYLARKDTSMSAQTREHLLLADQELDRVAHVAKQTLGFYRDNSAPAWFDASQAIDDLLEVYSYRLRNRDIKLEKELDDSVKVFASGGEFRQVFSNLLINAVDAVPPGAGKIRVRVRAAGDWGDSGRSGVRISVADTGCGIASGQMHKLFEPFYTTKQDMGTGLGLWLSRTVVQKHGGRIRVRSRVQPGRSGTVFSVFWPDKSNAEELAS